MAQPSFTERAKKSVSRFVKRMLVVLLLLGLGVGSFLYWGVYERGVMAGKVLRITQKGIIFKTYEGKLNLESFGALKGTSPIAETFDFSVEKNNTQVLADLEEVALSGERVNLHFVKRYIKVPWRGETRYFITRVERSSSRQ
jgi:hypothetical protein